MQPHELGVIRQPDPFIDFLFIGSAQVETQLDHRHGPGGIGNNQVDSLNDSAAGKMSKRSMCIDGAGGSGDRDGQFHRV